MFRLSPTKFSDNSLQQTQNERVNNNDNNKAARCIVVVLPQQIGPRILANLSANQTVHSSHKQSALSQSVLHLAEETQSGAYKRENPSQSVSDSVGEPGARRRAT